MAYLGTYVVRGDVKLDVAEELRRLSMQLVNIISKPASDEVRTECIALCAINISTIAAFVEQENLREIERANAQPLRFQDEPELCVDEGCPHHGTPHVCISTREEQAKAEAVNDALVVEDLKRAHYDEWLSTLWRKRGDIWYHSRTSKFSIKNGSHERGDGGTAYGYVAMCGEHTKIDNPNDASGLFSTMEHARRAVHDYMTDRGYFVTSNYRIDRWYGDNVAERRLSAEKAKVITTARKTIEAAMADFVGSSDTDEFFVDISLID